MNQTAVLICTDMSLISEMPCIALLHLMRIRSPSLLLVFGRGWGFYDRCVYNRAFLEDKALFRMYYCDSFRFFALFAVYFFGKGSFASSSLNADSGICLSMKSLYYISAYTARPCPVR